MQYSTSWLRADPSLIHQFCRKRPYSNKPVISAHVSWSCISCNLAIDTSAHAKWCIAHEDLREGLNLDNEKDLVRYISKVLARRVKKV